LKQRITLIFQAAQTKFLRAILGIKILDKIRNTKIRARLDVKYMVQ